MYTYQILSAEDEIMSTWRRKAIEALPELRGELQKSSNPISAWIEIYCMFSHLDPENDYWIIKRTLRYARWCSSEDSGTLPNDTSTAVVCAFYEHLPENKEHRQYFNKWFSPSEFEQLCLYFRYHYCDDEIEELKKLYYLGK